MHAIARCTLGKADRFRGLRNKMTRRSIGHGRQFYCCISCYASTTAHCVRSKQTAQLLFLPISFSKRDREREVRATKGIQNTVDGASKLLVKNVFGRRISNKNSFEYIHTEFILRSAWHQKQRGRFKIIYYFIIQSDYSFSHDPRMG